MFAVPSKFLHPVRRCLSQWRKPESRLGIYTSSVLLQSERDAIEAPNDPVMQSLLNQTAKMREKEANTDWRAIFMPNSRHFMFEGALGTDDYIVFREHDGPRNWRHNGRKCSIADLAMRTRSAKHNNNNIVDAVFHQQMELVRQTYNEQQDGTLQFTAKFGHLYLVDVCPGRSLTVLDFNHRIVYRRNDRRVIRTSFVPTATPSQQIVNVLLGAGFRETKKEEAVVVSVDHPLKSRKTKRFEVVLDGDLAFQGLRQSDRCFLNIDVRRKDSTKPDIRIAVKSVDEEVEKGKIGQPGLLYAQDHIAAWDADHGLVLDRSVIGKVNIVRHKVVTSCKLVPECAASDLERIMEVKMMDTTYYEVAQPDGSFNNKHMLTEVYICINGKDDLFRVSKEKNFLPSLLHFCDKF